MKRVFGTVLIIMAAMMSASCVAEISDVSENAGEKVGMTFTASFSDTRTTLVDGVNVWWNPGDAISINGDPFYASITESGPSAEFTGETAPAAEYRAVASNVEVKYDGGVYNFSLSSYQQACKDDLPIFCSAAKCVGADQSLRFRSLLGYIKFTIPEGGWLLNEVVVSANGGETLALRHTGYSKIDFSDNPVLVHPDGDFLLSAVTLISPWEMKPGDYYIALYPGTYSRGLKFTFKSGDGKMAIKNITKEITLEPGTIKNIGVVSEEWCADNEARLESERKALIELYNATGGDKWKNNDNWCSDKPIEEWYGISTDESGLTWNIYLADNNLAGTIPESVGGFSRLSYFNLRDNNLTGSIPESIGNLAKLKELNLSENNLSGSIPESIGNMTGLSSLILRDNDLTGSIPESIGDMTNLEMLFLELNQLTGELPASIGDLKELRSFGASNNNLTGSIPESIGNLKNLENLSLHSNRLTGELPASIGNLTKLRDVFLELNELSGTLPESINNISTLEHFSIRYNYFTGIVPKVLMEMESWPTAWHEVLQQNGDGFSGEGLVIPAPKFVEKTIDGDVLDYSIYSENEYTVLFHYYDFASCSYEFIPKLVQLYSGYKNKGLETIAFSATGTVDSYKTFASNFNTEWLYITLSNNIGLFYPLTWTSTGLCVVDKNGYIVFNHLTDDYNDIDKFLLEKLGEPDHSGTEIPGLYESTDYSKDGEVKQLQMATKGKGVDVVLMGDAYSDRLIADGTYDRNMRTAMEKFFEEEPYKSFRDHFNVYSVTAVSKNELYAPDASTAFDGYFGDGTEVGGDNETAFSYARKAISDDRMDQALIVVMMNSTNYAGTCYMYYPSTGGDFGNWGYGVSVSYFPKGMDSEILGSLIHHEAGGHGFAKLGDEYAYIENGHISSEAIESYKKLEKYGWWKNVDFTDDPDEVKWTNFLNDDRYASEGLGIYEGACTFWSGAYRPTDKSIMRDNTDGFNAPSREAIYYRIHKLAYGQDWEYDYEKFVEYDEINRRSASGTVASQNRRKNYVERPFEPTAPPVIVKGSWRDAR